MDACCAGHANMGCVPLESAASNMLREAQVKYKSRLGRQNAVKLTLTGPPLTGLLYLIGFFPPKGDQKVVVMANTARVVLRHVRQREEGNRT